MSKFSKKKDGELPAVSTASLPDIVFMLLFFFMTVTVMKDSSLKVDNILPNANEIKKLEKKDRIVKSYRLPHLAFENWTFDYCSM